MFIIGLTLQMIMWRVPRASKVILALALVVSYIIPGVITYQNKFEGIIVIRPESQKYGMWFDDIYRKIYIPTHTNSGTYLAGMAAGLLYNRLKKRQTDLKHNRVTI